MLLLVNCRPNFNRNTRDLVEMNSTYAAWKNMQLIEKLSQGSKKSFLDLLADRSNPNSHGQTSLWLQAIESLPANGRLDVSAGTPSVSSENPIRNCESKVRSLLSNFHPWRKGPFRFFDVDIDTEWRSNLKWDRLTPHLDFRGKRILDVGCGNGYYGWRMLASGADFVLGCDPTLLYVMQFEIFRRHAQEPDRHIVLPIADHELPEELDAFDMTFSMGVLYHRPSPIEHLQKLASTLKTGGQLVLETLIIDSADPQVLVPHGRYAKMRNVWFIPSIPMLEIWMRRTGFHNIQVLDVTRTTTDEQRKTDWMTFESLEDFLAPDDPQKTIEGYPGPIRAMVACSRG